MAKHEPVVIHERTEDTYTVWGAPNGFRVFGTVDGVARSAVVGKEAYEGVPQNERFPLIRAALLAAE